MRCGQQHREDMQLLCLGTFLTDGIWGEVPGHASAQGVAAQVWRKRQDRGGGFSVRLTSLQLWHCRDFAMALPSAKHLTNSNPCQSTQGPVGIAQR